MSLPEIGVLWLWFLLFTLFVLSLMDPEFRKTLGDLALLFRDLWQRFLQWRKQEREEEPIDRLFEAQITRLLQSGFLSASLRVGHKGTRRQMEFRKYIRAAGDYGIELVFPDHVWASDFFPKVRDYCEAQAIPFRIEQHQARRVRQVLYADCDQSGLEVLKSVDGDGTGMLIVDDLVDTGRTAELVRAALPKAHFATVYAKPAGRPMVDTFITEVSQDTWIYFPWDTELTFVQPIVHGGAAQILGLNRSTLESRMKRLGIVRKP